MTEVAFPEFHAMVGIRRRSLAAQRRGLPTQMARRALLAARSPDLAAVLEAAATYLEPVALRRTDTGHTAEFVDPKSGGLVWLKTIDDGRDVQCWSLLVEMARGQFTPATARLEARS